jgi:hypothetical protein
MFSMQFFVMLLIAIAIVCPSLIYGIPSGIESLSYSYDYVYDDDILFAVIGGNECAESLYFGPSC